MGKRVTRILAEPGDNYMKCSHVLHCLSEKAGSAVLK